MSSIQIFYHMYCVNDCNKRFVDTYTRIKNSGLLDKAESLSVVLVGPEKQAQEPLIKDLPKVKTFIKPNNNTEADTLRMIWDYANTAEGKVLYLHSKGVTKPNHKNIQDWKELMEYFLIDQHEKCIESLDSNDVCGVNYLPGRPHYSGNFWWATTKHIKKLRKLKTEMVDRLYCEYWLFDIDAKIKRKEIYNSGIDHYKKPYPKELYVLKNK